MIPKRKSLELEHVWDELIDWSKRGKADRARLQLEKDREFQRKTLLAADALITTAAKAFFRGIMIGLLILALLYCVATCGLH